jgi:hypothetical protein
LQESGNATPTPRTGGEAECLRDGAGDLFLADEDDSQEDYNAPVIVTAAVLCEVLVHGVRHVPKRNSKLQFVLDFVSVYSAFLCFRLWKSLADLQFSRFSAVSVLQVLLITVFRCPLQF